MSSSAVSSRKERGGSSSNSPTETGTSLKFSTLSMGAVEEKELLEKPKESMSSFVWALAQFTLSSVGMMLGNKVAVNYLPLPCSLVIIQVLGTLGLLLVYRSQLVGMKKDLAQQWIPCAALFTLMIYTSLQTFLYVNVSTVIIFRNVGAIATTAVEYFTRGVTVNTPVIVSEICIVLGAYLYGMGNANFNWIGFAWIMVNIAGQVAYGVLVRIYMDKPGFKEMSKYTMSLYNNSLALPFLFMIFLLQGEHHRVVDQLTTLHPGGWGIIAITCVLGFLISTSGFGLQKLVSATTFLVINNLAKFLNIGLGMIFLSDKIVGVSDGAGCALALIGGGCYSFFMMKLNESKAAAKKAAAEACEAGCKV